MPPWDRRFKNKMKKLIFFSKHMGIGGLEKALLNLLNSLARFDYQVTLVLEEKRGAFLRELDGRVEVREFRLSACPIKPLRRALNLTKRLLWRLKNAGKYDFSCAYCTYSVIGSRLAQYASRTAASISTPTMLSCTRRKGTTGAFLMSFRFPGSAVWCSSPKKAGRISAHITRPLPGAVW